MAKPQVTIKYTKLFINNEFVDSVSGKTFTTINPVNETVVAKVAEGDKADIDKAVAAAKAAFEYGSEWRSLHPDQRATLMNKLADLLERDAEQIAALQTWENGKPYVTSWSEVNISSKVLRYYAGWCDKVHGQIMSTRNEQWVGTRKEPLGVIGQITPWDGPIVSIAFKLGPALATGCTVILKPAEQTPLCALHLAALTKEAGFPRGVFNVVPGYGPTTGAAIAEHPDIAGVTFTGSVEVGKKIMIAAGKSNLKRVTLELGGKNPLVVCEDANVDEAVKIAHEATFTNSGQICIAASRIYVHSSIYDEFVKKSTDLALKRKLGDPFDPTVVQGPQLNKKMFDRVMNYIKIGIEGGAKLEVGGERFGTVGYYIKPTIFSNVTDDMRIAREEIFGPVQLILKYDSIDDVIERANDSEYGLVAGIITNDMNKTLTFMGAIEAGTVWVNHYASYTLSAPFGGWKQSGIGRELGAEALDNYLAVKTCAFKVLPTV